MIFRVMRMPADGTLACDASGTLRYVNCSQTIEHQQCKRYVTQQAPCPFPDRLHPQMCPHTAFMHYMLCIYIGTLTLLTGTLSYLYYCFHLYYLYYLLLDVNCHMHVTFLQGKQVHMMVRRCVRDIIYLTNMISIFFFFVYV